MHMKMSKRELVLAYQYETNEFEGKTIPGDSNQTMIKDSIQKDRTIITLNEPLKTQLQNMESKNSQNYKGKQASHHHCG